MSGLTTARIRKCINFQPLIVQYCGFCNYPCSYIIVDEVLGYDEGCDCLTTEFKRLNAGWKPVTKRDFEEFMAEPAMRDILIKWCEQVEAKIANEESGGSEWN